MQIRKKGPGAKLFSNWAIQEANWRWMNLLNGEIIATQTYLRFPFVTLYIKYRF